MVLQDTGAPGTSGENYSEETDDRNHCTSWMRSQPQFRNDKYIMMQYTNWINSGPSHAAIAFEGFSSMARALGL